MKLWWVVSVLKCIPILTPPPPIRAHVPRSLPVSQQMLIGVTPLHSQLHCISLIICTGMTHTHTQGFPCCLGDEMPACVCEGQCVAGVWVRCVCVFVCWWSRGCAGVGSRRVPGFPPNESGISRPPLCPLSTGLPRELGPGASLISTIILLSLQPWNNSQITTIRQNEKGRHRRLLHKCGYILQCVLNSF